MKPKPARKQVSIDLHGYHPNTIQGLISDIVQQAAEMGATELEIIHGHGLNRAIPRVFANTNTGYLGLTVRSTLRCVSTRYRYAKIDVSDPGVTWVRIKPVKKPTRTKFDALPELDFR